MVKVFVVLDGIGDRSCKQLGGATPLEAAKTKNLNYFASNSNGGYVYSLNEQIAPESDEAIMALLGYDPHKYYYGRGPLEAYGSGMNFKNGNLALRTNFSTIENGRLIDRRAGRTLTTKESQELAKAINENVKLDFPFEFKATVGHRGVLMFKGEFSDNITNVDPAYKKVGKFGVAVTSHIDKLEDCRPLDPNKNTKVSAALINEFVKQSQEILSKHPINIKRKNNYLLPANVIVPRDAGNTLPELPPRKGWTAVVSMPLEVGITKLAGMNVIKFEYPEMKSKDVYDNLFKGLKLTIKESIKAIKEGNSKNYFIHFKETDIPGHDNRPKEKKKMIELIDKKFFKFLRKKVDDLELVVTGDHSTPCELKSHTSDSVPLIHYNLKLEKKDDVQRFTEHECLENGSYGKILGKNVLKTVGFIKTEE